MAEIDVAKRTGAPILWGLNIGQRTGAPILWGLNIGQRTAAPVKFTYDTDAGAFRLAGTVSSLGSPNQPLRRRVNLIDERTGRIIRETWSDATTGAYSFDSIAGGRLYTVISYDHTGLFRAVIADKLNPTAMP